MLRKFKRTSTEEHLHQAEQSKRETHKRTHTTTGGVDNGEKSSRGKSNRKPPNTTRDKDEEKAKGGGEGESNGAAQRHKTQRKRDIEKWKDNR